MLAIFDEIYKNLIVNFEWGKFLLFLIFVGTALFLFVLVCFRSKFIGQTNTIKYDYGHPCLSESKEGIIEVDSDSILFKEFIGDKEFFTIPLRFVINVNTDYKKMGDLAYFELGAIALLSERNYLFITYNESEKIHVVRFSTHRHSFVNEQLKDEIIKAKEKQDQA